MKRVGIIITVLLLGFNLAVQAANQVNITTAGEFPVYAPGEKIVFNFSGLPPAASLVLEVKNWDDRICWNKKATAEAAAAVTLPSLENGYYVLTYTITDGTQTLAKGERSFAVIPAIDNRQDREHNQFGAMVSPHSAYPLAEREKDAKLMQRIGLRWVRTHRLNWAHVQPSAKQPYDWKNADAEVRIYQKYGLDIVATCAWPTPGWASDGFGKPDIEPGKLALMMPAPQFMPEFRKFYQELAARYRGRISYYEVGNEMDAFNFWLGSYEHYRQNNQPAIMKDFCQMFNAAAEALKAGDPNALVGPNTTGAAPEGHTYKPWLETMYKLGIGKQMDFFSTHYMADVPAAREIMKKYGRQIDIIFTEIGGVVNSGGTGRYDSRANCEQAIKQTVAQFTTQYSHGGKALCKFLWRDLPEFRGNPPWLAAMLTLDYTPRPEFVAYATLVRMLSGATPVKELNITHAAKPGWLQGFAFVKDGKAVNVLWLNEAGRAEVTLESPDTSVEIVDVMGRGHSVPVTNGRLEFTITDPVFLLGKLKDAPGPVVYPQPKLIKTVKLDLPNGDLEKVDANGRFANWKIITDEMGGADAPQKTFTVTPDQTEKTSGQQSLKMNATQKTHWWGAMCSLPFARIPQPGIGQYLEFVISFQHKGKDLNGIGGGATISFRDAKNRRIQWRDLCWERGNYDWTKREFVYKCDRIPPGTQNVTLEFYLGQSCGSVWVDDIKVSVRLWEKSNADIGRIN